MWRVLIKPIVSYQVVAVIFRFIALSLLIAAMIELILRMDGKAEILDPRLLAPIGILTSALLLAYNTASQVERDTAQRLQDEKESQITRREHLLFLCRRLADRTNEIRPLLARGHTNDVAYARQRAALINNIWKTFYKDEYIEIVLPAKETISSLDSSLQNMTAACASPAILRAKTREESLKKIADWDIPNLIKTLEDELKQLETK